VEAVLSWVHPTLGWFSDRRSSASQERMHCQSIGGERFRGWMRAINVTACPLAWLTGCGGMDGCIRCAVTRPFFGLPSWVQSQPWLDGWLARSRSCPSSAPSTRLAKTSRCVLPRYVCSSAWGTKYRLIPGPFCLWFSVACIGSRMLKGQIRAWNN
jgi:hypothetical protein